MNHFMIEPLKILQLGVCVSSSACALSLFRGVEALGFGQGAPSVVECNSDKIIVLIGGFINAGQVRACTVG